MDDMDHFKHDSVDFLLINYFLLIQVQDYSEK